jgi:hypothetical protein
MSIEQLWPRILGLVNDGSDQNVVCFFGVEDEMRLKTKPAKSRAQIIGLPAHARKLGQQSEDTIEPRVVRIGLIASELKFRIGVDFREVMLGSQGGRAYTRPLRIRAASACPSARMSSIVAVLTRSQSGCDKASRRRRNCSSRGNACHAAISASLGVADGITSGGEMILLIAPQYIAFS